MAKRGAKVASGNSFTVRRGTFWCYFSDGPCKGNHEKYSTDIYFYAEVTDGEHKGKVCFYRREGDPKVVSTHGGPTALVTKKKPDAVYRFWYFAKPTEPAIQDHARAMKELEAKWEWREEITRKLAAEAAQRGLEGNR